MSKNNFKFVPDLSEIEKLGVEVTEKFIDEIDTNITCPHCGQLVHASSREVTCPHCNYLIIIKTGKTQ
jgi:DNA-directed RNA polymerase subunit RPC12/RpoP